jgi:hypothetical protein
MNTDSQHVRDVGMRVGQALAKHMNERMPVDAIAREIGLSTADVMAFFELRDVMEEIRGSFSSIDENGTRYWMIEDDPHALMSRFGDLVDTEKDLDQARQKKLAGITITMIRLDEILSGIALAIFCVALAFVVFFVLRSILSQWSMITTAYPAIVVPAMKNLVVPCIAFGTMWNLDKGSGRALLKKGLKTRYGFDTMIAGTIGCFAWGIGSIFIVKGLLLLIGEAIKDRTAGRPAIASLMRIADGLNASCWVLPVFVGTIILLIEDVDELTLILSSGIFAPTDIIGFLPILPIIGIIAGGLYHSQPFPAVKRGEFKGTAVRPFVLSLFCMACFGTGVPMLVQAGALYGLEHMITHPPKKKQPAKVAGGPSRSPARAQKPVHPQSAVQPAVQPAVHAAVQPTVNYPSSPGSSPVVDSQAPSTAGGVGAATSPAPATAGSQPGQGSGSLLRRKST